MRSSRSLVGALVGLSLALAPVAPVHAQAPAEDPAEDSGEDTPAGPDPQLLENTGELFMAGQGKFDTSDFEGAIELWTAAYNLLPNEPAYAPIRATLLISLANAQVEAYAIDKDAGHLRTADDLFTRYLDSLDPEDEENRAAVEAEQAKIRPTLEQAEKDEQEREAQAHEREAAAREEVARSAAQEREQKSDLADTQSAKRFRAMRVTGGALMGVGGVFVGLMFAGMGLGAAADNRGEEAALDPETSEAQLEQHLQDGLNGNRLAWTGGIMAGIFVLTGAGVLIGAHSRRRKDLERLDMSLGPRGFVLRGRF